jgi:diguanylate cyclase (GGDEF)-like protein/PAS domain S-box-containing protein
MPVSLSTPHFLFHSIPLQLVMVLPFVLQAMMIVGLTDYLSHSHWSIWAYGWTFVLSIGFGTIVAYWIGQRYQSSDQVEVALKESQEKHQVLSQTLPMGMSITEQKSPILEDNTIAEQAMRLSESRLQTFINNAPTPISIKDLEGKYLSINSEFAYWMQVSAEDVLGKHDYEVFSAENAKISRDCELQAIFEGISITFEDTIPLPDGLHTFIITKFPLMDTRDSPYAIAGIYLDISDRKQAEIALAEAESSLRGANQELQKLVNLDGLTQIANRRCFDERVVYEWQRLYRDRQPLSLLMFDVDYFKRYNDFYGHQLGDQALLLIAQAVDQLVCRPADLVARYGGEEFIVILPNTNLEGAIAVAKNLHKAIADLQIPHQDSDVSDIVTVSMGLASDIPNLDRSPYVLINQADQALYYAKQQGRNRSVIFTD